MGTPWADPPEMPTQVMSASAPGHTPPTRTSGTRRQTGVRNGRHRPTPTHGAGAIFDPTWIKVVAALATVVLVAAASVYVAARRTNPDRTRPADDLSAPTSSPPTELPSSTVTAPTTSSVPSRAPTGGAVEPIEADPSTTTTAAPAPDESGADPSSPPGSADALSACSAGQRSMIERGNHPWEWYVARFDDNGDGILCN